MAVMGGLMLLRGGSAWASQPSALGGGIEVDEAHHQLMIELPAVDLIPEALHHHTGWAPTYAVILPASGWMRGLRVTLVDDAGRNVPRRVLHHIKIMAPRKRELFSAKMLRVASASVETPDLELPRILGYRFERGETLLVNSMLHDPDPRAYEGVRVRIYISYTPAAAWPTPVSVYPLYMRVVPPGAPSDYDVPPGRSVKSWEGRPAVSGRLLAAGAHLHRYGVNLRLDDVTAGQLIWEAAPSVDATGAPREMPITVFLRPLGVRIRRDHVYRLTAVYQNPTGRVISDGGMGILGGVFYPSRHERWPGVDPQNPLYQADIRSHAVGDGGVGRPQARSPTKQPGDARALHDPPRLEESPRKASAVGEMPIIDRVELDAW